MATLSPETANNKHDVENIIHFWVSEVANQPDNYLVDASEHKLVFVAGGSLPTVFGWDNSTHIWPVMDSKLQANNDVLNIAGIDFTRTELVALGDFYRWLEDNGFFKHCIDERLADDLVKHHDHEVHEECGACAALGVSLDLDDMEELLLKEKGRENFGKQPLRMGMEGVHSSLTTLVDFHGADIVREEHRVDLQARGALPFNVSMPLSLVEEWVSSSGGNVSTLLEAMIKWNPKIARNIIGGNHNTLSADAERAILVVDTREVNSSLLPEAMQILKNLVPHGRLVEIQ